MGLFSGAQKLFFVPGQERCSRPIHSVPGEPGSSAYAAALGGLLSASPPPTRRLLEDASATVSSQPPTRRLMRTVAGSKRRWVSFPGRKTFSVPGQELRSGPISRSQANLVSRLCGGVGRSPFGLASAYAAASRGRVSDRFFSAAYAAAHANRCRLEEEMGLFSGAQNFFCPRSGAMLPTHLLGPSEPGSSAYTAAHEGHCWLNKKMGLFPGRQKTYGPRILTSRRCTAAAQRASSSRYVPSVSDTSLKRYLCIARWLRRDR